MCFVGAIHGKWQGWASTRLTEICIQVLTLDSSPGPPKKSKPGGWLEQKTFERPVGSGNESIQLEYIYRFKALVGLARNWVSTAPWSREITTWFWCFGKVLYSQPGSDWGHWHGSCTNRLGPPGWWNLACWWSGVAPGEFSDQVRESPTCATQKEKKGNMANNNQINNNKRKRKKTTKTQNTKKWKLLLWIDKQRTGNVLVI